MSYVGGALIAVAIVSAGCGASSPSAATSPPASPAPSPVGATAAPQPAEVPGSRSDAARAEGRVSAITVEKLASLLEKGSTGFPKASERDATCTFGVGLVGELEADYRDVVRHCGTGIGMKAYTESRSGKLDPSHHRGDAYDVTLLAGLCYRMLVVGDSSLSEITMRLEHPDGAIDVMAETKEGVLIVDPKTAWCEKHDRALRVTVEAHGAAAGAYTLGVWARPGN